MGAYRKAGNGNEMETGNGNWILKTEMETRALVVIHMLLVFIPRHPSALQSPAFALATPSCSVMCDC